MIYITVKFHLTGQLIGNFVLKSITMKKILIILIVLCQILTNGQSIPNGSFENWNIKSYDEPTGYSTGNPRDMQRLGIASVTKVTGVTGFAVRIQSNVMNGDTSDSYMINIGEPCSDPPQWRGGVPFSQIPSAITGSYRYNLAGNDTAILFVIFLKNGIHLSDNFFKIRGTGAQSTFTAFSLAVASLSVAPDSVIIAAACSNKKDGTPAHNGSFIEFDNLGFAGASQALPNGDFESWTTQSIDVPTGWTTWNQGVSRSASFYDGTYAVRLETTDDGNCSQGNINGSGITTGHNTENSGPAGGLPYSKNSDTLSGYYKYTPAGNDSAMINVNLTKNKQPVGGMNIKLGVSASYKFFKVAFSSGNTPDTMRIDIQSSKWNATPANIGSVLYIDRLQVGSQGLGIASHSLPMPVTIFPNPVSDELNIVFNTDGVKTVEISGVLGNTVYAVKTAADVYRYNAEALSSGMYIITVSSSQGTTTRKFIRK